MKNFFVSYNGKDKAWAEWIAWQLEESGYTTIIQAWDFQAGGNFVLEMQKATKEAEGTVAVLSQNYLDAEYTHPEWAAAFAKDPQGTERKLIPVRVAECQLDGLFLPIVYIDLVGTNEQTAKEALLNRIKNERAKPTQPPVFPGQPSTTSKPKPDFPGITPSERPWNVPHQRNLFFTGREKVLEKLHQAIAAGKTTALAQPQAISGLGGIGKTQTAVEYAYRYRDEYAAVLWAKAETRETLISDFVAIAHVLALPQKEEKEQGVIVTAVKRWLEATSNWLLIFDNADDPKLLEDFVPLNHIGHILLTSRAQLFDNVGTVTPVELGKLSPTEAEDFLHKRTGRSAVDPVEEEAVRQLAYELDYLPLALEQAGAYITARQAQFQDYLFSYRNRGLKLLEQSNPVTGKYPQSVATTWLLNFEQVEQTNAAAADLLRLSTFLHSEGIPLELITCGAPELGPALATALAKTDSDPLVVDELLEPLIRYSLISRNLELRTYNIHRLVQEVIKDGIDDANQRQWAERIVQTVSFVFPDPQFSQWPNCARLLPQVKVCLDLFDKWQFNTSQVVWLFNNAGIYLRERARFVEAKSFYRPALKVQEKLADPEHPSIVHILNNLAVCERHQGKYNEAESLYLRALSILEKNQDVEPQKAGYVLNNLAQLYEAQGKYGEAEPLYRRFLEICETTLETPHSAIAIGLHNLAGCLHAQGKYTDAEAHFQQALEIRQKILPTNHPHLAQSLTSLGEQYRILGRYSQAEPLLRQALAIRESAFSPAHPEIAQSLSNLGSLYCTQGRYLQAEQFLRQALAMRESIFSPPHSEIAVSLGALAQCLLEQNRDEEAESFCRASLKMGEESLGPDHPHVATNLNNLATLEVKRNNLTEAGLLLQRSRIIRESIFGPDHPILAQSHNNLAELYLKQKKYREAEVSYCRAIAITEKSLGEFHPDLAMVLINYAALLFRKKQKRKAEKILARAQAIQEK